MVIVHKVRIVYCAVELLSDKDRKPLKCRDIAGYPRWVDAENFNGIPRTW